MAQVVAHVGPQTLAQGQLARAGRGGGGGLVAVTSVGEHGVTRLSRSGTRPGFVDRR